jgi:hypothetical protein
MIALSLLLFRSADGMNARSAAEVERIWSNLVAHIEPSASQNTHGAKHQFIVGRLRSGIGPFIEGPRKSCVGASLGLFAGWASVDDFEQSFNCD